MDHPRPWLRYVDAGDLDKTTIPFDGMNVDDPSGEKLGDVDGFVIDVNSGRPYYVVVNGGGWFKSKYFLLPVGHVRLGADSRRMTADVARERVSRYPGFDRDEFDELTDAELLRMDEQMISACCPNETVDPSRSESLFGSSSHYTYPTWWEADYYNPARGAQAGMTSGVAYPSRDEVREQRDRDKDRERELVVGQDGEVSPHAGGRAQPGDVTGFDEGGERTHLGDTSEDENERRRDAERDVAKQRRD